MIVPKILARLNTAFLTILTLLSCSSPGVENWLTNTHDGSVLFEKQPAISVDTGNGISTRSIQIDGDHRYQSIDGFGFTLTGGSAYHLMRMSSDARTSLLQELFGTEGTSIGVSYLRVSIGASDLNAFPFSYNDLPEDRTDPELTQFDLGPDRDDVIPILKEILAIYPELKIMGSPWSPPKWMKTTNDTRGGSLKPEYYPTYANYFVRYIEQMRAEGIRIDAVTVQNEPLHPGNNPSLLMLADEMGEFVKNHLGPAFEQAGIDTKIIIYDHNCDRPDYPISILDDPDAKRYVAGSAFHLYGGTIDALSTVHEKHPDRELHFTEQWMGAPGDLSTDMPYHTKQLTIGATRNWSRTVLEWNLANGPDHKPHTDRGGCDRCLGGITIDGDEVIRNPAYYVVAHAAKFVRPGSLRIASNEIDGLPNVAFVTPKGDTVLIVLNDRNATQTFYVKNGEQQFKATLQQGAVATYIF